MGKKQKSRPSKKAAEKMKTGFGKQILSPIWVYPRLGDRLDGIATSPGQDVAMLGSGFPRKNQPTKYPPQHSHRWYTSVGDIRSDFLEALHRYETAELIEPLAAMGLEILVCENRLNLREHVGQPVGLTKACFRYWIAAWTQVFCETELDQTRTESLDRLMEQTDKEVGEVDVANTGSYTGSEVLATVVDALELMPQGFLRNVSGILHGYQEGLKGNYVRLRSKRLWTSDASHSLWPPVRRRRLTEADLHQLEPFLSIGEGHQWPVAPLQPWHGKMTGRYNDIKDGTEEGRGYVVPEFISRIWTAESTRREYRTKIVFRWWCRLPSSKYLAAFFGPPTVYVMEEVKWDHTYTEGGMIPTNPSRWRDGSFKSYIPQTLYRYTCDWKALREHKPEGLPRHVQSYLECLKDWERRGIEATKVTLESPRNVPKQYSLA